MERKVAGLIVGLSHPRAAAPSGYHRSDPGLPTLSPSPHHPPCRPPERLAKLLLQLAGEVSAPLGLSDSDCTQTSRYSSAIKSVASSLSSGGRRFWPWALSPVRRGAVTSQCCPSEVCRLRELPRSSCSAPVRCF